MIKANGELSWVLKPATAIRKAPAAVALETKGQNARLESATRKDEQAKQAEATKEAPAPQSTTVVTQGPAVPGVPGVAVPTARGPLPKK